MTVISRILPDIYVKIKTSAIVDHKVLMFYDPEDIFLEVEFNDGSADSYSLLPFLGCDEALPEEEPHRACETHPDKLLNLPIKGVVAILAWPN